MVLKMSTVYNLIIVYNLRIVKCKLWEDDYVSQAFE